ncbi:hypothetical protein [Streptomyces decoyicus]
MSLGNDVDASEDWPSDDLTEAERKAFWQRYADMHVNLPGKRYTLKDAESRAVRPTGKGPRFSVIPLRPGDSMDDATSSKGKLIHGPKVVQTTFSSDGGVDQRLWDLWDEDAPRQPQLSINAQQLKALRRVADNPNKVVAWLRGETGYLEIHGNIERSLFKMGLIAESYVKTAHRPGVGPYDLNVWELTDLGRSFI